MRAFVGPTFRHLFRLFPADRREYGTRTALARLSDAVLTLMVGRLRYRVKRQGSRPARR